MADAGKRVAVVGIDDSIHSYYALEWAIDLLCVPFESEESPFKLIVVHARPTPSTVLGFTGPGSVDTATNVERDLVTSAESVIQKAEVICSSKKVKDVQLELMDGDPKNVMIEAIDKFKASVLILGSHGYGPIKRAVLGSVSDYCAHHAHCSVMIVKKPKTTH